MSESKNTGYGIVENLPNYSFIKFLSLETKTCSV